MTDQTEISRQEAYLYASAVAGMSVVYTFIGHNFMFSLFHIAMKVRVATCSLIYRKSLRLSSQALGTTTVGKLVNLLSNDVNRFDAAIIHMQTLFLFPIWISFLLYIIYAYVGPVACLGIATFVVYIPIQRK